MVTDRTVPSERNNTYDPSDVSRKTNEDLFETAFNSDQKTALLSKFAEGGSGGGGVTPSIIKIAEAMGGGSSTEQFNYWSGGGSLLNGKTLRELVGDKTIIGVECVGTDNVSNVDRYVSVVPSTMFFTGYDPTFRGSLIAHQEELKECNNVGLSLYCVLHPSLSLKSGAPVEVYAVCV